MRFQLKCYALFLVLSMAFTLSIYAQEKPKAPLTIFDVQEGQDYWFHWIGDADEEGPHNEQGCIKNANGRQDCFREGFLAKVIAKPQHPADGTPIIEIVVGPLKGMRNDCHLAGDLNCDDTRSLKVYKESDTQTVIYATPQKGSFFTNDLVRLPYARLISVHDDYDLKSDFERGQDLTANGYAYESSTSGNAYEISDFNQIAGKILKLYPDELNSEVHNKISDGTTLVIYGYDMICGKKYYIVKILGSFASGHKPIYPHYFTLIRADSVSTDTSPLSETEAATLVINEDQAAWSAWVEDECNTWYIAKKANTAAYRACKAAKFKSTDDWNRFYKAFTNTSH